MAASNRARTLTVQMTFLVDEETSRNVNALARQLSVSRSEAARIMLRYGTNPAKRFAGSATESAA